MNYLMRLVYNLSHLLQYFDDYSLSSMFVVWG